MISENRTTNEVANIFCTHDDKQEEIVEEFDREQRTDVEPCLSPPDAMSWSGLPH